RCRRAVDHDPGRGPGGGGGDPSRDRSRYEPVPDGRPSVVMGWPRATPRRECRQAPFHAGAPRWALAKTRARPMCLGRCACEGNVSAGAILSSQGAAGAEKAAIAVAASILTAVYHMLKDGTFYQDLGADYLVKRNAARTVAKLARRIKDLGFDVQYRATASLGHFPIASHRTSERHGVIDGIINHSQISAP